MSVLHVNQISRRVREIFEEFIPRSDLKDTDPELENKLQTRCLAAFAVKFLTDCTAIDAANSVTDGGDDNGLDAIYYSESQNPIVPRSANFAEESKILLSVNLIDSTIEFNNGEKVLNVPSRRSTAESSWY